jgi:hypothetical protein
MLDGLADVQRDLVRTRSAEGRSRDGSAVSTCGDRPNTPTRKWPKHGSDGRKERPLPNSPAATTYRQEHEFKMRSMIDLTRSPSKARPNHRRNDTPSPKG